MEIIEEILSKLEETVQVLELEFSDVLTDAPKIISILEAGFEELKLAISDYVFKDTSEEIQFFKVKKPLLFSKLIYFQKIYHIELRRPVTGYQCEI